MLLAHLPLAFDVGARFALALMASIVLAETGQRYLRLPRVTGYMLGGIVFGPTVVGLIRRDDLAPYEAIVDVIAGLLVFELGSRVDLGWLRENRGLLATSLVEALATFGVVAGVLFGLGVGAQTALLVGAIGMSTSPAIVVRIVNELQSRGQVTERAMLLSALDAAFSVVLVHALVSWFALDRHDVELAALLHPLYVLGGSFLLGLATATAVAIIFRTFSPRSSDAFVLALSVLLLSAILGHQWQLSAPLALLMGGILLRRRSERIIVFPPHFGTAGSALVLVLFVLCGVDLDLSLLFAGGLTALAVIAARAAVKLVVPVMLARAGGLSWRKGALVGLALMPMSGFALMLGRTPSLAAPEVSTEVSTLVLASVIVFELVGPLLGAFAIRCAREDMPESGEHSGHARAVPGL
ncbi:MAG: cation:proton antiporter [Burkholderiales bacterium]